MTSVMLRSGPRRILERWGSRAFRNFRQILPEKSSILGYTEATKICNKNIALASCVNSSYYSTSSWKRPEGPPRIWRVFGGRRKSEDGTIPRFTIQDLPEEMVEDVIDFMIKYIPGEEGFSIALGISKDPLALEDMRTYWRSVLRRGMSIVALAENSDSAGTEPVIVGANMLTVITKQDKMKSRSLDQFKTRKMKIFYGVIFDAEDEADVLNKYGTDKYLGSVGLVVHPSFRGHGLGETMLKVREDIGRAYKIPVTEATFTMKASQIAASRAGFELQFQKEYSELLDYEGKFAFPGATGKFIHVMTKRLY